MSDQDPPQRNFFRTTSDEKENQWSLKSELAEYIDKYISSHLPDKELECITIPNPVPSNIIIGRRMMLILQQNLTQAILKKTKH